MNQDSYTQFNSQSWFSRIRQSIKSIFFGLLLFSIAFPLLWWNEGRSVERYNSLEEGQNLVIAASTEAINPENNGKLIHIQGLANTDEILTDDAFGVSVSALKLIRFVSMYQWKETQKTETYEEIGGTKTTQKTYVYSKDWSSNEILSGHFKQPAGHENPPMLYKNHTFQAQNVHIGAFKLNADHVNRLTGEQDFSIQNVSHPKKMAQKKVIVTGTGFYLGNNPAAPQLGDLQVSFKRLLPTEVTLIAQQQGNHLNAYHTQAGSDIDLLEMGLLDAHSMFTIAQTENTTITWAVRLGGFLLMWIGLSIIFKPLAMLGAVLPFLGDLIAMGTGILAFLISLPCTMLVIAIAWIAYRPFLAISLIAIGLLAIISMKFMPRSHVNSVQT